MNQPSDQSPRRSPKLTGLCHIGMYATDPAKLAVFYQEVLGMELVGGSDENGPDGPCAFLSGRPYEESHEIAIFNRRDCAHMAFKVSSLEELRAFYGHIVDSAIPIRFQINHGVSLAFYFNDPEGNTIEVYWPTGLDYRQPYAHPIDLAMPAGSLLEDVKSLAEQAGKPWPSNETADSR